MNRRLSILILFIAAVIFSQAKVFAESKIGISGAVEWDASQLRAAVTLDLASANIRLPSGRTQAENILAANYLNLIRPNIFRLQVDSSSTIGDLVDRGELKLQEADSFAFAAVSIPAVLSGDMKTISANFTLPLSGISDALIRHRAPAQIMRTLSPVTSARYTGIIIIASDDLPVHGQKTNAKAVPCLFPKIRDTDMNLIYEKNMLEPEITSMVRYAKSESIFQTTPSGLSPELTEIVGDKPLRIFARGVFGIKPTDLIIDSSDALRIISSQENFKRFCVKKRILSISA